MADRFFPNELPDVVVEKETDDVDVTATSTPPLMTLLSLPYQKASQVFLQAAIRLKEKVVKETWISYGRHVKDFTLYTGTLGTAYLLLKSYEVTKTKRDLDLCNDIIRACDVASQGSDYVTFICGRAGICALGAVGAKYAGDEKMLNHYISSFKEIKLPPKVPNELLYGRAGFLWACSYLNKRIGEEALPLTKVGAVVNEIILEGRKLSGHGSCPLMYEWHGKKYWGAAHGLTGIMHALMDFALKPEDQEYVRGTLRYMIQNRFPSGNYPSSEGSGGDRLVHWCHGAPGVALTLTKAYQVFDNEQFLRAASDAAEVLWNRGLLKKVGICHGVSGNAYVFLSLYRTTGNTVYLYRAKAFASFLLDKADLLIEMLIERGEMHGGDRPYSLFEGQGGMAALLFDMVRPSESRFPGYEI